MLSTQSMHFSRLAISVVCLSRATASSRNNVNSAFISHCHGPTITPFFITTSRTASTNIEEGHEVSENDLSNELSPWAPENVNLPDSDTKKSRVNKSRFRQHVNPLSRKFQMQTELSDEWPANTFHDPTLPLHIDIGCGKGGFLLKLASQREEETSSNNIEQHEKMNYLGLEIRPSVALYAKERVEKWGLSGKVDFIGCNVNVDLERILAYYFNGGGHVGLISIQYPDPHFKKQHQKRRVVTPELVKVMAKYIPEGREIFIQSDIQDVLDNMRMTLREIGSEYFTDILDDTEDYLETNPIGVATEREISVLKQDLPVYRTVFIRNDVEIS